MKKLLFILFFIPLIGIAQNIRVPGLGKVIIGGHVSPPSLPVDTSAEILVFSPIMNNSFDATRPNKKVYVTGTLFYNENDVNTGYGGTVAFINTGGWVITVNGNGGTFNTTVTATYIFTGGALTWH